jgi:hypothetical protein
MVSADGLFADAEEFPCDRARERFEALVGLDDVKRQLLAEARVLLDPGVVESWSKKAHRRVLNAVADVMDRTALVVLAGDVGTGKTELAETVGDPIARGLKVSVTLFPLSLSARGHGAVGEMIRGIDGLRRERLPVLIIMCTNRVDAIDPAVRRRAAAVLPFIRPGDGDREALLRRSFEGAGVSDGHMSEVVRLTGPVDGRRYGCTYSDLRQRFVPAAVLAGVDTGEPITGAQLIDLARSFRPTRPFNAQLAES